MTLFQMIAYNDIFEYDHAGDINRNIMTPPAPLSDPAYQHAFQVSVCTNLNPKP